MGLEQKLKTIEDLVHGRQRPSHRLEERYEAISAMLINFEGSLSSGQLTNLDENIAYIMYRKKKGHLGRVIKDQNRQLSEKQVNDVIAAIQGIRNSNYAESRSGLKAANEIRALAEGTPECYYFKDRLAAMKSKLENIDTSKLSLNDMDELRYSLKLITGNSYLRKKCEKPQFQYLAALKDDVEQCLNSVICAAKESYKPRPLTPVKAALAPLRERKVTTPLIPNGMPETATAKPVPYLPIRAQERKVTTPLMPNGMPETATARPVPYLPIQAHPVWRPAAPVKPIKPVKPITLSTPPTPPTPITYISPIKQSEPRHSLAERLNSFKEKYIPKITVIGRKVAAGAAALSIIAMLGLGIYGVNSRKYEYTAPVPKAQVMQKDDTRQSVNDATWVMSITPSAAPMPKPSVHYQSPAVTPSAAQTARSIYTPPATAAPHQSTAIPPIEWNSSHSIATLMKGTDFETPVYYTRGARPGSTIMAIGAQHGNEVVGPSVLNDYVNQNLEVGQMLSISNLNMLASKRGVRLINIDANRTCGKNRYLNLPEGKLMSQVETLAVEIRPDVIINLHSTSDKNNANIVYYDNDCQQQMVEELCGRVNLRLPANLHIRPVRGDNIDNYNQQFSYLMNKVRGQNSITLETGFFSPLKEQNLVGRTVLDELKKMYNIVNVVPAAQAGSSSSSGFSR